MVQPVERRIGGTRLVLRLGDITEEKTDAIVNAANPSLAGGGGVDGTIHRAGGPTILAECQAYVHERGPLPPGRAMWTRGGNLPARTVIHTVGPIYRNDRSSAPVLASAYTESLRLAEELNLKSVSFPSISTGAYGYPMEKAARVALATILEHLKAGSSLSLVQVVCFSEETFAAYRAALEGMIPAG